jgi:hypothetical protein
MNHIKNAVEKVMGPDPQFQLHKYPESLVISPDLFKKLAAPDICGE